MKQIAWDVLILFCLAALILIPRLAGLDAFVSVDEPDWLKFGANFFRAVGTGDFASSVYDYHPGVITMWLVTAAFLWVFRAYRAVAPEYFWKGPQFDNFLSASGHPPVDLIWRARLLEVLLVCVLLLLVYACLHQLVGRKTAVVAVLFVSFEPFFWGHSRLLNHEGLLALFGVLSVLTLLIWAQRSIDLLPTPQKPVSTPKRASGRWSKSPGIGVFRFEKKYYLVLSAIFAALAQLTKSSAIVLLPLAGLILFVKFVQDMENHPQARVSLRFAWTLARSFLFWLGLVLLVYFVLWPGMWVNPGEMLYRVYGNAFSYAFQGARLEVTQDLEVSRFGLESSGILEYLVSMLWRSTPVVWIGSLLAVWMLFSRKAKTNARLAGAYLLGLAVLYVLLFGIARGRNAAHYILTSYVCLDLAATLGFMFALERLAALWKAVEKPLVNLIILAGLIAAHGAGALPQYPYYYTYSNPIMQALFPGQNPNYGYAEVLEQAAHYLAAKPGASKMIVTAWYGRSFSYYFPGTTLVFKPMAELTQDSFDHLHAVDYLVVYYAQQKKRDLPIGFIQIMEQAPLEKVIWFNGIEYIRIYKVSDLPESVFKALSE